MVAHGRAIRNEITRGDCLHALAVLPPDCIDLIVTSPPYADARKGTYGGIHPDEYVEWFLPRAAQMFRTLNPSGSFVLNIKEKVVDGERHPYVMELVLAMRKQGWRMVDEYMWHKKNCAPGKWPNRFRDAWERCLHFTKSKDFYMDQDAVRVPMGDWRHSRLKNLSETDKRRDNSKVKSGFGKKISNWIGRDLAYPSNVLHLATECSNRGHSAVFPPALPEFFIKLFTKPGDLVADPFVGSGTVPVVAAKLGRDYLGIDTNLDYVAEARVRAAGTKPMAAASPD
jgi:site-specific DNA-methyltransferase (adenine-specific)